MLVFCFVLNNISKHALQHSSKASRKSSSGYSNHSFTAHPLEAVDQNCPVETSYASSEIIYQQLNHRSASMVCQVSTLSPPLLLLYTQFVCFGCWLFHLFYTAWGWRMMVRLYGPRSIRQPRARIDFEQHYNIPFSFILFLSLSLAIIFRM